MRCIFDKVLLVLTNTVLSKCLQKAAEMLVSLSLPVVTQQQNSSQPFGCENSTWIWGLLRAPFSTWCLKELLRYFRLSISTLCFTRRSLSRRSRSSWPRMGSMENSLREQSSVIWWLSGLVTNSFLFCWLFTIKNWRQMHNQRLC